MSAVGAVNAEHREPPAAGAVAESRLASLSSNRYEYWKVAVRSFGEHPLAGVGTSGFAVEWLRERPFDESVRDAHSLYLETAAELGIVGLLALALSSPGVVRAARDAIRAEGGAAVAAAAGTLAVLAAAHAALDGPGAAGHRADRDPAHRAGRRGSRGRQLGLSRSAGVAHEPRGELGEDEAAEQRAGEPQQVARDGAPHAAKPHSPSCPSTVRWYR